MAVLEILRQRCPIRLPIANAIQEEQMFWTCAAIRGDELDAFHALAELLAQTAVTHRSKLLEISDDHDIRQVWLFLDSLEQTLPFQIVILRPLVTKNNLVLPET